MRGKNCRRIFIDPPYHAYDQDRLFDDSDPVLSRNDALRPFSLLREALRKKNIEVHTADFLLAEPRTAAPADYYSFGLLDGYEKLLNLGNVRLRAFVIFEPPILAPRTYSLLPKISSAFEQVYIHNTAGDGYSMTGTNPAKLRKFYWPQSYNDVLKNFWGKRSRQRRAVAICANHKPLLRHNELYSKRIEAIVALSKHMGVDLYGGGWRRWWSRNSLWLPYWRNRRALMSVYRGTCVSKHEILSRYDFSICFENMTMDGYMTEKFFDCLYTGTIPIYIGPRDITKYVPAETFIDATAFSHWDELARFLLKLTDEKITKMRESGRDFLNSPAMKLFSDSLLHIINGQ